MGVKRLERPDRAPLELLARGLCPHRHYGGEVDEDAREVTCRGCGQRLDPFEVLLWFAKDFKLQKWKAQELQEAIEIADRRAAQSKGRAWAKSNGWQWDSMRKAWYKRGHWVGRRTWRAQEGWWLVPESQVTTAFLAGNGPLLALGAGPMRGPFDTMTEAMKASL